MRFLILFVVITTSGLFAQSFPKCPEACNRYYTCALQKFPNASEEQKNMLKKGCELNCNKAKYYGPIAACLSKSGGKCDEFSACVINASKK